MIIIPPHRRVWIFSLFIVLAGVGASLAKAAPPNLPPINEPPTNQRLTGKPIWFDLLTDNLDAAKQFYGRVFGWKFADVPDSQRHFSVISAGNERIGGIFQPGADLAKGVKPHWLTFLSVPDADAAARYVKGNGGQIMSGPTSVPARGTHLVFRDPQGALVGVLKSDSGDPPDEPAATGEILWADLFASNPANAATFYQGLASLTPNESAGSSKSDRIIMNAGGFSRVGIKPLPAGAKPGWLPYVQVSNVPETLKRVKSAGGRILVPPSPNLLDGRVAVIADPQGGVIGIVHWIPQTKKESRQ